MQRVAQDRGKYAKIAAHTNFASTLSRIAGSGRSALGGHTEAHTSCARLRDIVAGERSVLMASVHDPISARIAQELGCEAALMGGSLASMAVLGAPDLIVLTLTELAEQVRRCTRASEVPLVVDGDHGYGNAINVMRTVQGA